MKVENRAIELYLVMLLAHVAHVFEEVWARFWMIDWLGGLGGFLIANWILFCIPVVIFYFLLRGKGWARQAGIAYAGIMIANGILHNVMMLATERYFDGPAGGVTGITLVAIGVPMVFALRATPR